jgi:hypothetical protein
MPGVLFTNEGVTPRDAHMVSKLAIQPLGFPWTHFRDRRTIRKQNLVLSYSLVSSNVWIYSRLITWICWYLFEKMKKLREFRSPRRSLRNFWKTGAHSNCINSSEWAAGLPGPLQAKFDLKIPNQGWDLNPRVWPYWLLCTNHCAIRPWMSNKWSRIILLIAIHLVPVKASKSKWIGDNMSEQGKDEYNIARKSAEWDEKNKLI